MEGGNPWACCLLGHIPGTHGHCLGRPGLAGRIAVFVPVLGGELLDELLQGHQLPAVDEAKLLDEEDEVLEGGVEVCLLAQLHHLREVLVVDVGVHPEQPFQDRLGNGKEVLGERHPCGRGR